MFLTILIILIYKYICYNFFLVLKYRGSVSKHLFYYKGGRKYYNGSAAENTNLKIFVDTCL